MKKLIAIALLAASCAIEAPAEGTCDTQYDQGYDEATVDISTELEQLREELEWTKFLLEDEKAVCESEWNRLNDQNQNLYQAIQILERQGCEL
jgi:ferritin-like protein